MLRTFTATDYEKMASTLAERFAANPEQNLETLAVKHACGLGMVPDQIRNLVQALNNMAFLKLFQRDTGEGKDPTGEFSLAEPDNVIQKVVESAPEDMKCPASEDAYDSSEDMHGDFPDLLHGKDIPEDGASIRITIEKNAEEKEPTTKTAAPQNHIRGQRTLDGVNQRKFEQAFEVLENVEKLAYDLQHVNSPELSRVRMLVEATERPLLKNAFALTTRQMGKDAVKIAAASTPRVFNPKEYPLPELTKIADGLLQIRVLEIAAQKVGSYVASVPH